MSNFAFLHAELGETTIIDLPGVTPGTDWERFRAKEAAYLDSHRDHVALQRLCRNKPLTADVLTALARLYESPATMPRPARKPCSMTPTSTASSLSFGL